MEVNVEHEDGQRNLLVASASASASSSRHDLASRHTSSSSELDDDVPTFLEPWQQSPSRRVSIVDPAVNSPSSTAHSPRHSAPNTPTARRSSSSIPFFRRSTSSHSSSGHLHNLSNATEQQNHSLFVEDLPEFQPYSLFGISSSPHRRRFKSSPTVSYILRRRSNATGTPPSRTPTRSLSGDGNNNNGKSYAAIGNRDGTDKHHKKKQRWKPFLLASAVLSIASAATAHVASRKDSQSGKHQPDMVQLVPSPVGLGPMFSIETHQAPTVNTTIARRPSKLKKRPPKTVPHQVLLTRRGSTYTEWRRSMVVEVSADVSRRSSQRSKRSSVSRAASSSARTGISRTSKSKQAFLQDGGRRSLLQRCCRRLRQILRCGGRRRQRPL